MCNEDYDFLSPSYNMKMSAKDFIGSTKEYEMGTYFGG